MTVRDATRRALRVFALAFALTLALATGSALAANFAVNTTSDTLDINGCTGGGPCSLRDAVQAANNTGGSNTIDLPAGTYGLTIQASGNDDNTTGDLNITSDITITGAGAASTTIDGGGSATTVTDRVFRVESLGSLTLSGATIQHGHPAGGAAFPLSEGGGILALGALKLTDATVQDNFVDSPDDQRQGGGAGISQGASVSLALTRVNVSNNHVNLVSGKIGGGGGLMLAGGSPGSVTIADSTISGNTGAGPGGGIYSNPAFNGGAITITGTTISGNHAQLPPGLSNSNHAWGGGLATDGALPVSLSKDTISGNTADQSGGGIFDNGASTYTIVDTSVLSNAAVAGCTACGVDFLGGGGIVADGGTRNPGWTLSGDLIALNTAGDSSHPNVPGGGIDEDGGDDFTVVNTTIFGNSATGLGGGYESSGGGRHALTNDTIDGNTAGSGGGDIDNSGGGTFTLANTIVARGTPANCATSNNSNLPSSLGHNLESANTCGLGATGDQVNTDPKLGFSLGFNGGPTFTEALPADSPAVDAGDNSRCPSTDQRGAPRSENAVCDIGAYEFQHSITVTNAGDSGTGSFRDAINLSGAGTTIDFSPALDGSTIILTGALSIPHALTISGPGAGKLTINGNNNDTVFDIEANTDNVTISGLTITGGSVSGAGNTGGGGIFAGSVGVLTLNGLAVSGNTAAVRSPVQAGGGGVYVNGGELIVTSSTIANNSVILTGANSSSNGGGAIYSNGGEVTVSDSSVTGNSVDQTATVRSGSDGGGGIYTDGGKVTVSDTSIKNNSETVDSSQAGSDGGGGLYSAGGKITINGGSVNGNSFTLTTSGVGNNGGGGVYSEGGRVTLTSSSIDGNSATIENDTSQEGNNGGGGLFSEGGDVDVTGSSISDNAGSVTAAAGDNGGGAVFDESSASTYLNTTISGNSVAIDGGGAQDGGGALHTFTGGVASDVTIAGNSTNKAGGGIFTEGTFHLTNTILAANGGSPVGNCAGTGVFTSVGHNLETGNSCGLTSTGDLPNTDPKLGPLQNNGGTTRTQALSANSPAVDAGSCTDVEGDPVNTDQRGTARPQPTGGKCDIGAFELEQATQQQQRSAPSAQTTAPTTKNSTGATLSGSVNPQGQATTYFFQYGLDRSLRPPGASTALYDQSTAPQSLPADSSTHPVAVPVSGLVPNALYHFRLVATNPTGTTFGSDQTFSTPTGPAPPPPVLAQTEDAKPVSGRVFALVNGQLVPVTETQKLPSGTVLDTRRGTIQLTAAAGGRKTITGVFSGAIFKLTQARNGLTTLALVEGAFKGAPTYASCRARGAGDAHAALSSRVLQTLRSRASGRFRTRGRYAAGTVRGTRWTTTDRCDGTLIAVQFHSVLVTDLVKHITVLVKAGQRYLARARK